MEYKWPKVALVIALLVALVFLYIGNSSQFKAFFPEDFDNLAEFGSDAFDDGGTFGDGDGDSEPTIEDCAGLYPFGENPCSGEGASEACQFVTGNAGSACEPQSTDLGVTCFCSNPEEEEEEEEVVVVVECNDDLYPQCSDASESDCAEKRGAGSICEKYTHPLFGWSTCMCSDPEKEEEEEEEEEEEDDPIYCYMCEGTEPPANDEFQYPGTCALVTNPDGSPYEPESGDCYDPDDDPETPEWMYDNPWCKVNFDEPADCYNTTV